MTDPAPAPGPQQRPETWDAVAPTYAEDVWQWSYFVDEALRALPVGPSDRVLDVATGPGTLAFGAAARAARVDAVDFSPGMIEELTRRAVAQGVSNLEGAVMDAQALSFPDASFDVAFCMFAYFFFPDRAKAFREMHRVLRPGGRALVATWSPIERRPLMKTAFDAVAEALPQLPRPAKGDLQDPAECIREMTDGGFRDVDARSVAFSVRIESPQHYLDLVTRSGAPFAVMKKKVDAATWAATMERILDALRARIPETGTELGAEAIFTTGTR